MMNQVVLKVAHIQLRRETEPDGKPTPGNTYVCAFDGVPDGVVFHVHDVAIVDEDIAQASISVVQVVEDQLYGYTDNDPELPRPSGLTVVR